MKNAIIQKISLSLLPILLSLSFIRCTDEMEPNIHPAIKLLVLEDMLEYPNHGTINFVLEVYDKRLGITKVEIAVNDSIVRLPTSLQNWESPYTYASYYWYEQETLPIGNHSIKVLVYDDQNSVTADSLNIEIEDFREKYYGDYHFTSVYYINNNPNPYDTTYFDGGWMEAGSAPRQIKIQYGLNSHLTPDFYKIQNTDRFGSGLGPGKSGGFMGLDTLNMTFSSSGAGGSSSTIITGIRK